MGTNDLFARPRIGTTIVGDNLDAVALIQGDIKVDVLVAYPHLAMAELDMTAAEPCTLV